jgi:hypothetical protein
MGILGYSQLRLRHPAVEEDGLMGQWALGDNNLLKLIKEEKDIREFMKHAKSKENSLQQFYNF